MTPIRLALVALAAALPLAGCGKMGALDRPGPLFGHGNAAADAAAASHQDPNRPLKTLDRRDRDPDPDDTTDLSPIRSRPVQGSGQDPLSAGPSGALPDPYANPQ
ncbi:hypothetical protein [Phenylobacterium sp.]|jgi:hypothetical protein|uniref:hypothetical protein n=1 Tax=Phenylobacterium sp. TaxID=1871053 RepID=UPI002F40DAAC